MSVKYFSPVEGARIWLSGSVPEPHMCTEQERSAILEFVNRFSMQIYQSGGHILHGSHPSFTPILLEQAENYQKKGGKKDCLTLCISRFFSKENDIMIEELRRKCSIYETPEAPGNDRDASLIILRKWIAARSDAIVAVGGKWWIDISGRAGVPVELECAIERGIPCFLLGGLGGATKDYLSKHHELLLKLKNGLTENENKALSCEKNVSELVNKVSEQLCRLPLVRGRGSDGISFRILALDGGGIKGAFTASAIATWETKTKLNMADHFDLIAGTSTGGILAIGLGLGLSGKEMLEFYKKRGQYIFPVTSLSSRFKYTLRHLFQPKYSQETLLRELEEAFYGGKEQKFLKESKCRLLIPTYHAIAGKSYVFRTPHHSLLTEDGETPAAAVALATAAAPSFFSASKIGNMTTENSYFDGGVWANSPVMAAIVEAVCFFLVFLWNVLMF